MFINNVFTPHIMTGMESLLNGSHYPSTAFEHGPCWFLMALMQFSIVYAIVCGNKWSPKVSCPSLPGLFAIGGSHHWPTFWHYDAFYSGQPYIHFSHGFWYRLHSVPFLLLQGSSCRAKWLDGRDQEHVSSSHLCLGYFSVCLILLIRHFV